MKEPRYFEELPESMTVTELAREFYDVLESLPQQNAKAIADALFALSDRQWHTYSLLSSDLRSHITSKLIEIWDDDDVDRAQTVLAVASRLGLRGVLDFLQSKAISSFSSKVGQVVREGMNEIGDTIDDPYSGMK